MARLTGVLQDRAIEALRKRIAQLENIQGGPGVVVHRTPGGIAIHAKPAPAARVVKADVSGDSKVLAFTHAVQDTDTYDRATDRKPVEFQIVTDVRYNADTHKLLYRARTIKAVGLVSVSGEGAEIEILEFEPCGEALPTYTYTITVIGLYDNDVLVINAGGQTLRLIYDLATEHLINADHQASTYDTLGTLTGAASAIVSAIGAWLPDVDASADGAIVTISGPITSIVVDDASYIVAQVG